MKVREGNDWGAVYYTDARGQRVTFEDGATISVRWPDGSETREKVIAKITQTTVSDHGKSYPVGQVRFGLMVVHRGVRSWVSITDVEIAEETP